MSTVPTGINVIALDADGVLLDYNLAYAHAWKKAFGIAPEERHASAYWAYERWAVPTLVGNDLAHFRAQFDEEFWSSVPAVPGAVQACEELKAFGFDLICVTALAPQFRSARHENLRLLGIPVSDVFVVDHATGPRSPKADLLTRLGPAAFVDDYLPYFLEVPKSIHRALVDRDPVGSPNSKERRDLISSSHASLAAFATFWIKGRRTSMPR